MIEAEIIHKTYHSQYKSWLVKFKHINKTHKVTPLVGKWIEQLLARVKELETKGYEVQTEPYSNPNKNIEPSLELSEADIIIFKNKPTIYPKIIGSVESLDPTKTPSWLQKKNEHNLNLDAGQEFGRTRPKPYDSEPPDGVSIYYIPSLKPKKP